MAFILLQLVLTGMLWAAEDASDPYETLARGLADAARRGGATSVAVMPFSAAGEEDAAGGRVLAERVMSRLSAAGRVRVVERVRFLAALEELRKLGIDPLDPSEESDLYDRLFQLLDWINIGAADTPVAREERAELRQVLNNRKLAAENRAERLKLRAGRPPLGVEAVVIGTFVPLEGGFVEVHARVIAVGDSIVLGAASVRVKKEWDPPPAPKPLLPLAGVAGAAAGAVAALLWFMVRSAAG